MLEIEVLVSSVMRVAVLESGPRARPRLNGFHLISIHTLLFSTISVFRFSFYFFFFRSC